ncbi:MAG TPA: hypothetical protein VF850_13660 [Gemmatimonadaceae bacterium]
MLTPSDEGKMNRNYCITSAIVFTFVALVQAWRFVLVLPMQIGAWNIPRSVSGVAALGAAFLALWAFRSARPGKSATVVYT